MGESLGAELDYKPENVMIDLLLHGLFLDSSTMKRYENLENRQLAFLNCIMIIFTHYPLHYI